MNEDSADLNRNSVDFAETTFANPTYLEVDPLLLLHTQPPNQVDQTALRHYMIMCGKKALQDAATSGQYRVPNDTFYGGGAPYWNTLQMREIVSRHVAVLSCLVWIDLHTDLGYYGHSKKIFNSPGPAELERAMRT